jgi:hypothetical protein
VVALNTHFIHYINKKSLSQIIPHLRTIIANYFQSTLAQYLMSNPVLVNHLIMPLQCTSLVCLCVCVCVREKERESVLLDLYNIFNFLIGIRGQTINND